MRSSAGVVNPHLYVLLIACCGGIFVGEFIKFNL